ncbi:MAG: PAS domain S-box protein [Capsulimonadaceae bacterium]
MNPPLPVNETQRLKALADLQILDTMPEQAFDDITELASQICGTPIALITLVDGTRQWFKSRVGVDVTETPRDISFCAHAILQDDLFVVPDASADPRFADNPVVASGPCIRFYAGAPLIAADGAALGTLCVIDTVKRTLTPAQEHSLKALSRMVMAQFELRRQAIAQSHALTERNSQAVELHRTNQTLQAVIHSAPLAIVEVDTAGVVASWNKAAERIFGWTEVDVIGRLLPIVPSELESEFRQRIALVAGGNRIAQYETKRMRRDGTMLDVSVAAAPLVDTNGHVTGCIGIMDDISIKKQAEALLRQAHTELECRVKERTAQLAASNLALQEEILQRAHAQRRLEIQHAITRILAESASVRDAAPIVLEHLCSGLGWELAELWLHVDTADGLCLVEAWSANARPAFIAATRRLPASRSRILPESAIVGDCPVWIDDVVLAKDFDRASVAQTEDLHTAVAVPIPTGEGALGVLVLYSSDIQERDDDQVAVLVAIASQIGQFLDRKYAEQRRADAERRYRGIFENSIEGMFQTTPGGLYITVNPSLVLIYGYDSEEDLISSVTNIADNLYVSSNRREEFATLMQNTDAVANFESEIRRKDGSRIWISENARAVRDSYGNLLHYEGSVVDITERKAIEAERERILADAIARADHDPLTGLSNHRAFLKRLDEEADRSQRSGTSMAFAVIDLDNFRFLNDAYGYGTGDEALRRVAGVLRGCCRPYDLLSRFGGDEFAIVMPDAGLTELESLIERLRVGLAATAFCPPGCELEIPLTFSAGTCVFPRDGAARADLVGIAQARLQRAKSGGGGEDIEGLCLAMARSLDGFATLQALVSAVDNKDRYTRRHSEDVMEYSVCIASELGLDDATLQTVRLAALLHDVGKIGVPDHILRKPGALTAAEFDAVKQHPQIGALVVGAVPGLSHTLDAVRHHHERWDGGGYPFGLRGEQIPLLARLMAVADAYSAMTTDRPYRKGMTREKAMTILRNGAGTQWDPECVTAFLTASGHPHMEMAAAA